ncbi:hypothetical protein, partial [Xanthomonas vasicola]|uniref:hypothetical protein n=1 Tax=Xanthomonas vasicola TaxID=56459 RepID=UPI00057C85E2
MSRWQRRFIWQLHVFTKEIGFCESFLHVCRLNPKKGDLEIPSDFAGVVWSVMDGNGAWRLELAKELRAAGYTIDWNVVMG